ncbi:KIF20 [Lepeophtheirus salmonis]|uniref:KIF20 n=1 Tax=Lepeophtheirus salmonis TaxID=72036 RepID=A0A7R8CPF7_LEPSM|nr:KIF20 [Lepeophtheirus salmonis]CAF2885246.1 KIF20 [Lepeophtheirus salmonis]
MREFAAFDSLFLSNARERPDSSDKKPFYVTQSTAAFEPLKLSGNAFPRAGSQKWKDLEGNICSKSSLGLVFFIYGTQSEALHEGDDPTQAFLLPATDQIQEDLEEKEQDDAGLEGFNIEDKPVYEVNRFLDDWSMSWESVLSYRRMKKVFIIYNTIIPTSTLGERLFSQGTLVLRDNRMMISFQHFEEQLLMCSNKGVNDDEDESEVQYSNTLMYEFEMDMSGTQREREKIEGLNHERMFHCLWISFTEIYNEPIYDLFEKLGEKQNGSAYIKNLKEIPVSSVNEAYKLLLIGRKNLHFAATKLNHNSSRSHCIFTVKVIRFCDLRQPKYGRVNILSFCDLERIKKTRHVGSRGEEAGNINASLLVLGRVMKTLRDNQRMK